MQKKDCLDLVVVHDEEAATRERKQHRVRAPVVRVEVPVLVRCSGEREDERR